TESPSANNADSEHIEEVATDQPTNQRACLAVKDWPGHQQTHGNHVSECTLDVVIAQLCKLVPAKKVLVALAVAPVQAVKAVWSPNRERTKHVRVEDREDGSVNAKTNRDDRDHAGGKHRTAPHSAKRIANVGPECFNEVDTACLAALLGRTLTAAELQYCLTPCLRRIKLSRFVLPCLHLQMELQFFT